jgi:hypothetical protein
VKQALKLQVSHTTCTRKCLLQWGLSAVQCGDFPLCSCNLQLSWHCPAGGQPAYGHGLYCRMRRYPRASRVQIMPDEL